MSTDIISDKFVEIDRRLQHGFSLNIIFKALELSDEEKKSLIESNQESSTKSVPLKVFLQLVENKWRTIINTNTKMTEPQYIKHLLENIDSASSGMQ